LGELHPAHTEPVGSLFADRFIFRTGRFSQTAGFPDAI